MPIVKTELCDHKDHSHHRPTQQYLNVWKQTQCQGRAPHLRPVYDWGSGYQFLWQSSPLPHWTSTPCALRICKQSF